MELGQVDGQGSGQKTVERRIQLGPVVVNAAPIPAEGGAASGRTYVLGDAPGPGTWHYRLEDLGASGKRGAHPGAAARVGPGAEGRALFVPSAAAARPGRGADSPLDELKAGGRGSSVSD